MEHKARPPARFSSLLGLQKITRTENKNQKEKPFTQNSLQNPAAQPIRRLIGRHGFHSVPIFSLY